MEKDIIRLEREMKGYTILKKDLLVKLATYLYVNTSYYTINGGYYISAEKCDKDNFLPEGWSKDHHKEIIEALESSFNEKVSYVEFLDDDSFGIDVFDIFAMGYIEDDQSLIENRWEK